MKLSTKGRYGLRAMIDMARYSTGEPVSIGSVALRQGISEGYLEQLVSLLKKAGLVQSIRGAGGGYVLAKNAEDISVGDILRALEACAVRRVLFRRRVQCGGRMRDEICLAED